MRIRTIKPEFWMHEGLSSCSEFSRLLAIALLNWSDDEGYFMANPILIRGQVFPFLDDSKKIPGSLLELSRVGWIDLGIDDQGRKVGKVINFSKHQRVDKPKPSVIKDSCKFQDDSKKDLGFILDDSKEEGKGMERNGKEYIVGFEDQVTRNPIQIRIGKMLGRRESTKWSKPELVLLKQLGTIDEKDLELMEEFYAAEIPKESDWRRTNVERLLRHWTGENDKARAWKLTQRNGR